MIQAVMPQMRKQKAGNLINLASISGTVTGPTQEIYSATKAEVIMLSETLAALKALQTKLNEVVTEVNAHLDLSQSTDFRA
ncbi:hypothetical protein FC48_GL000742 [Ligilactobacillus murinus DSM 20452 = NBRC 14221]|uniref:Uncharacterized protein n=1 Tax=Ligilactobacillus murinus DSM 20452 = NBRC 14221 TaxID=1423772 RepID=A0A0R2BCV0_9LACO|nr:hypothetical protein FC48_GL000742 [Ligilactobacillus murinus DSM 20452 = NBRC 14221]